MACFMLKMIDACLDRTLEGNSLTTLIYFFFLSAG